MIKHKCTQSSEYRSGREGYLGVVSTFKPIKTNEISWVGVGESVLFSGSSNSTNDQNGSWPSPCPGNRRALPIFVSSFLLSFLTSFPVFLPLFLPPDLHVEWGGYLGEMVLTELDYPIHTALAPVPSTYCQRHPTPVT